MLLQIRATIMGILNLNKKFISKKFVEKENRSAESSLCFHQDKMTFVYYDCKLES